MRNSWRWPIVLAGSALTTALLFRLAHFSGFLEPDRLYHLALLREAAQQHVWALRTWAQFPLLGWQNFFSDKEFLFHFLLALPYRFGGDSGALAAGLVFSALTIWLPALAFTRARWFALALSLTLFLFHPHMLFRFALLRPHTLASLLFTIFLYAFAARRIRWAAVALLLFPLAYHAFYVPLFFLAVAAAAELFSRPKSTAPGERIAPLATAAWLALAVLVGVALHPNFPGNVVQALQHFSLAFRTAELQESLHLKFGGELLPPDPLGFAAAWAGAAAGLLCAGFALWRRSRRTGVELALAICSFLFLLGSFRSVRLLEFAVPLWVLFVATVFAASRRRVQFGIICLFLLPQLPPLVSFCQRTLRSSDPYAAPTVTEMRELLAPLAGQHVRVFHDNWGLGSYVAYLLPEAEAIDTLDPTFLLLANPALAGLRIALVEGRVAQPVAAIQQAFGAGYALCEPSALQLQLLHAPGVKPISVTADKRFALFRLPERIPSRSR